MKSFLKGFAVAIAVAGLSGAGLFLWSAFHARFDEVGRSGASAPEVRKKTKEELIAEAREKSSDIRALYMTADVANDPGIGAARIRNHLIDLAQRTEINGMVIDVKETCGSDYNEARLKNLIGELHKKNIWAIARIVAFKDASERVAHPEWYLSRRMEKAAPDGCPNKHHLVEKSSADAGASAPASAAPFLWQDNKGGYWMDPASPGARAYIAGVAKKMIDLGFDELQFDYVRFPSDGDVSSAVYPSWDGKTEKFAVMKSFFEFLNAELKSYKPDIILSADLFGYVASQGEEQSIGQRVSDIGDSFDYVSFMVYPSHYYNGLEMPADPAREMPAVNFSFAQARMHPDAVVARSLFAALGFLNPTASSTATTSPPVSQSSARIRPWLEDFFHEADRAAARPYGAQKVRMQIDAAQQVEHHGWMLWNASNVYSEGALRDR